jgi:transposase
LLASQQLKNGGKHEEKETNNMAIDIWKRKWRAVIKDAEGAILDEFFFANDRDGRTQLVESAQKWSPCRAVLESTGNTWIKICDVIEESGIVIKVAHPYKADS